MSRPSHPDFPPPVLITTTAGVDAFCQRMQAETFIAVDTEFMRERTYWPELCLVQVAGAAEVAVIDADGGRHRPDRRSAGLFADQAVVKVFHAARQDIEIFVHCATAPCRSPLFDTQVAAMVAGFGDQVGYDALVARLDRRQHRQGAPLQRLVGAPAFRGADHLRRRRRHAICGRCTSRLRPPAGAGGPAALGRRGDGDPQQSRRPTVPIPKPHRSGCVPRSTNRRLILQVLKAAAAWREKEAQRLNIPRPRLIKDEALLEIAATAPDHGRSPRPGAGRDPRVCGRPHRRRP